MNSVSRTRRHVQTTILLIATALVLSNLASGAEHPADQPLFLAINERLGYMEAVALYKAQNRIPVEDIERERIVVDDAKAQASTLGLDAESMERFFVAQIDAAKAIQYRYRAELLSLTPPSGSVDLETEIRPALDRLGEEIVRLFAERLRAGGSLDEASRGSFVSTLRSAYLSDADRNSLFDAMRDVQLAD